MSLSIFIHVRLPEEMKKLIIFASTIKVHILKLLLCQINYFQIKNTTLHNINTISIGSQQQFSIKQACITYHYECCASAKFAIYIQYVTKGLKR